MRSSPAVNIQDGSQCLHFLEKMTRFCVICGENHLLAECYG